MVSILYPLTQRRTKLLASFFHSKINFRSLPADFVTSTFSLSTTSRLGIAYAPAVDFPAAYALFSVCKHWSLAGCSPPDWSSGISQVGSSSLSNYSSYTKLLTALTSAAAVLSRDPLFPLLLPILIFPISSRQTDIYLSQSYPRSSSLVCPSLAKYKLSCIAHQFEQLVLIDALLFFIQE